MNKIEVVGCFTCPLSFLETGGKWICGYPQNKEQIDLPTYHGRLSNLTPRECPLRQNKLTISLSPKYIGG